MTTDEKIGIQNQKRKFFIISKSVFFQTSNIKNNLFTILIIAIPAKKMSEDNTVSPNFIDVCPNHHVLALQISNDFFFNKSFNRFSIESNVF